MLVVAIILLIIIIPWLVGFYMVNDFHVKQTSLPHYKQVFFIFPHPDDEVINAGGLISEFSKVGSRTTLVVLTKGERGTIDGHSDYNLKTTRTKEAQQIEKILGVKVFIQKDFGDGELVKHKTELKEYIDTLLNQTGPDLVVTYDLSGLYGHEDHIVCSQIVTDLIRMKYPNVHLWYTSLPKKVLSLIHLPEQMAKDPNYQKNRAFPAIRIFVGSSIADRIHAIYTYKSQFQAFRNTFPIKFIPLWYYYSMQLFEYYAEAN
jgi:LmbE family N-acetylglucosaminyl deacetylase